MMEQWFSLFYKVIISMVMFVGLIWVVSVAVWFIFSDESPLPNYPWVRVPIGLLALSVLLTTMIYLFMRA